MLIKLVIVCFNIIHTRGIFKKTKQKKTDNSLKSETYERFQISQHGQTAEITKNLFDYITSSN